MIITAGQETIQAIGIIQGQGGVQGVMCDTVQITLPEMPTKAQVEALMAGAITDDGRELTGYDGLAEVRITLYRQPQDARDRAMQEMTAEVERRAEAERQAVAEKAQAQAQAEHAAQQAQEAQEKAAQKEAVLMTVADALPDEIAAQHPEIYPNLIDDGKEVLAGQRRRFVGVLYKANVTVWDRPDQWPDAQPELWTKITQTGGIEDWVQPAGAHDAYHYGDVKAHVGKVWRSTVEDGPNGEAKNVWEPGVYGWEEVVE